MLIFFFSSPPFPHFIIHFGLILLSTETTLILYYFHFTDFMTSPYPHIISRGNFTPSRPFCFLFLLPVSLISHSLSLKHTISVSLSLSISFTPYSILKLLVSSCPAEPPSIEAGKHPAEVGWHTQTHTHTYIRAHTHTHLTGALFHSMTGTSSKT